jgi:transketolase
MNYEEILLQSALADERIIVMTAENRAAIRNLSEQINGRLIDTGIAEQTMVGMAAGLALRGRMPVLHALATFLTMRAFEFIRTDVGIANLPVKLVGAVPGFLSEANGPAHQAIEDISLMRGIPGMNIFCPSDEADLVAGMPFILSNGQPWYIRFNNQKPLIEHSPFVPGKSEVLTSGSDVTFLTYGFMLGEVIEAAKLLQSDGISAGVINLRTLRPIDSETIVNAAKQTSLVVPVEDHLITGGLYSILCEILVSAEININVFPVALKKWFKPSLLPSVLEYEGFTGISIADKVKFRLKQAENSEKIYPSYR